MKTFTRLLARVAALGLAVLSVNAMAATECNGPLSGTITAGVVVNAGPPCVLIGANVAGGVQVNKNGILIVCGSIIYGGIRSNEAGNVLIGPEEIPHCNGASIYGGVRIRDTGPGLIPGQIPPPSIAVERSMIEGGVHLVGNSGAMVISNNNINGVLSCRDNTQDPKDEGHPNFVTGAITCKFGT